MGDVVSLVIVGDHLAVIRAEAVEHERDAIFEPNPAWVPKAIEVPASSARPVGIGYSPVSRPFEAIAYLPFELGKAKDEECVIENVQGLGKLGFASRIAGRHYGHDVISKELDDAVICSFDFREPLHDHISPKKDSSERAAPSSCSGP